MGNFITLEELFTGSHKILEQPYSPMTIRFFILQAHYRSTLDFSNEALQAAEKGLKRFIQAVKDSANLEIKSGVVDNVQIEEIRQGVYKALCDDLNTPVAIAHLFDAVKIVNQVKDKTISINEQDKLKLSALFKDVVEDVLGLVDEQEGSGVSEILNGVMEMLLEVRSGAKKNKDFATSDLIRDRLNKLGITIKDTKEGTEWSVS